MTPSDDPAATLKRFGQLGDDALPLAEAALALAGLDWPGKDLGPYRSHIAALAADTAAALRGARQPDAVAGALADVIASKNGYSGDTITYDDMQNADLIRVIDRRRGLPVALGILYLDAAQRIGATASGLNAPGHFLVQIGSGDGAVICDPFNAGVSLPSGAARPVKSPPLETVSNRDVLLRLVNNARSRSRAARDDTRVLVLTERMILVAPQRGDLWLELAHASEAVGKLRNAMRAFEACIALCGAASPLGHDAALALAAVKRRLN
jgi:regulator of sirC expression with transglutaminase-like and TPR domain